MDDLDPGTRLALSGGAPVEEPPMWVYTIRIIQVAAAAVILSVCAIAFA